MNLKGGCLIQGALQSGGPNYIDRGMANKLPGTINIGDQSDIFLGMHFVESSVFQSGRTCDMFTRQSLAMQDTTSSSSNSKGKHLTQWLLQGLTIVKTSLLLVLRNVGLPEI
jgi:hypothetical protein